MATEAQRITAAELALGLLDPEEAYKAERLMREDREFAAEFAWWEDRFAGALDGVEAQTPPRDLMPGIRATLFGTETPHEVHAATRPFPWMKLILGVIAFKAILLSTYFYLRSAANETFQVESRYGQSVLTWNARTGQMKLTGPGSGNLYLWLDNGGRFTFLGPGGETLRAGLEAGAVVVVSTAGRTAASPDVVERIVLSPH